MSVVEPGNFKSNIMKNMRKRSESLEHAEGQTLFVDEYKALKGFTVEDRSHHKDPVAVANAVVDALFSEQPKFRYLVAPNQKEADLAIRAAISKVAQLNSEHEFSLEREALISILDAVSQ